MQAGGAGAELAPRRSTAAGGEPRWWWSGGVWRAPRPKRGWVATSVRVAWPTTPAPPGAPLLFFRSDFVSVVFGKTRTRRRRENDEVRLFVERAYTGGALLVMPALVAGIHVLARSANKDVDGRNKSGHDGRWRATTVGITP